MQEMLKVILGETFLILVEIYIISKILNKKIEYKNKKFYIGSIITIFFIILNYNFSMHFMKVFLSTIILFVGTKFIFEESISKSLCSAVLAQIIFFFSEIFFLIIVAAINNFDVESLINTTFGMTTTNIIIALISLAIVHIKFIDKNLKSITNLIDNINNKTITILIILSIIIINLLLGSIYKQVDLIVLMIINTSFMSLIIYAVYNNLTTRNKALIAEKKNIYYEAENNALLNTLNEYERIADQHRVINHENKNQLCALKQMVENNDSEEEIIGYVNKLLNDKKKSDETVLAKTKRIPSGGLQGIVYQKLMIMKKKKIKYSLNISRDLKELDFRKLGIETNVDMCKVIGVFLDNAIEEIKGMKEKVIDIELYKEDSTFCIGITNNFGKNKKWEEIDELGYSSKGEGHGYGLSLVKQILENNNRLENERKITGKYFTQILKIHDMK